MLFLVGLISTLAGGPALAETHSLSIAVTVESGTALPSDATIEVELLEVSRADAPSTRLASRRFELENVPALLLLPYDSEAIDDRLTYVVAARVSSGGGVRLRTTAAHPVLTRGATDSVEIVLVKIGAAKPNPIAGQRITGVSWAVMEIRGRAVVADDVPTIGFLDDGTFSMFGGCNRFRGVAQLSSGRIAFVEPIAGTRMMCPPSRMSLENGLLEALKSTVRYERNAALLSFTNNAGVVVVRFREAPE